MSEVRQRPDCLPCPYGDTIEEIKKKIDALPERIMKLEIIQAKHISQIHDCDADRGATMDKVHDMETSFAVLVESLKPLKEHRKWFIMMVIGYISMTGAILYQVLGK